MSTVSASAPTGPSYSLELIQVGSVELVWTDFDEIAVGYIGELVLSSGDLMEHKVYDGGVNCIALDGDLILICAGSVIQMLNLSTCSFLYNIFLIHFDCRGS
jgi:hypothetical protein